jgi:hypothetical protein
MNQYLLSNYNLKELFSFKAFEEYKDRFSKETTWNGRTVVHLTLATIHFFPVLSQVVYLVEWLAFSIFSPSKPAQPEERSCHSPHSSISPLSPQPSALQITSPSLNTTSTSFPFAPRNQKTLDIVSNDNTVPDDPDDGYNPFDDNDNNNNSLILPVLFAEGILPVESKKGFEHIPKKEIGTKLEENEVATYAKGVIIARLPEHACQNKLPEEKKRLPACTCHTVCAIDFLTRPTLFSYEKIKTAFITKDIDTLTDFQVSCMGEGIDSLDKLKTIQITSNAENTDRYDIEDLQSTDYQEAQVNELYLCLPRLNKPEPFTIGPKGTGQYQSFEHALKNKLAPLNQGENPLSIAVFKSLNSYTFGLVYCKKTGTSIIFDSHRNSIRFILTPQALIEELSRMLREIFVEEGKTNTEAIDQAKEHVVNLLLYDVSVSSD